MASSAGKDIKSPRIQKKTFSDITDCWWRRDTPTIFPARFSPAWSRLCDEKSSLREATLFLWRAPDRSIVVFSAAEWDGAICTITAVVLGCLKGRLKGSSYGDPLTFLMKTVSTGFSAVCEKPRRR